MARASLQFLCAHVAALAIVLILASLASAQGVIAVPNNDPEMDQAIAKARASLGQFWTSLEKHGVDEDGFNLKVAIRDGADVEHFWLSDVARKDGKLEGTVGNAPAIVGNVEMGQRYTFTEADISDWMFMRRGKIVGNETMRPLLKRMPKAQADEYRAMLETP